MHEGTLPVPVNEVKVTPVPDGCTLVLNTAMLAFFAVTLEAIAGVGERAGQRRAGGRDGRLADVAWVAGRDGERRRRPALNRQEAGRDHEGRDYADDAPCIETRDT